MLPLFDVNPHRRTPVVVVTFVAANVVALGAEALQLPQMSLRSDWALVPAALWQMSDPRPWATVFTHMFLHAGWVHLLGNCWFLWLFGNNIEDRLGHVRFVVFYLLSGLGAAALQVLFGPKSLVPMVGASGAISGVLGAYLRYFPKAPIFTLVPFIVPIVPIPAFVFAGYWFMFQFWQGTGALLSTRSTEGGVAWWAHVGGFVAGFWLAGVMRPTKAKSK